MHQEILFCVLTLHTDAKSAVLVLVCSKIYGDLWKAKTKPSEMVALLVLFLSCTGRLGVQRKGSCLADSCCWTVNLPTQIWESWLSSVGCWLSQGCKAKGNELRLNSGKRGLLTFNIKSKRNLWSSHPFSRIAPHATEKWMLGVIFTTCLCPL